MIPETFQKHHILTLLLDTLVVWIAYSTCTAPLLSVYVPYLQVIGQFSTPSIPWVHCDEDCTGWDQWDLCAFKHEVIHLAN